MLSTTSMIVKIIILYRGLIVRLRVILCHCTEQGRTTPLPHLIYVYFVTHCQDQTSVPVPTPAMLLAPPPLAPKQYFLKQYFLK